jgi:hypothetical protein
MGDPAIRDYLRHAAETAPVVGSVCTGALIRAAAGLLQGRQATTHWAYHRMLERLGATYLPQRWVEDGRFITSAAVSAGIDTALALVARLTDEPTARMVQLAIEYDPHPPLGPSTGTRWTGTSMSQGSAPWSNSNWPTGPSYSPSCAPDILLSREVSCLKGEVQPSRSRPWQGRRSVCAWWFVCGLVRLNCCSAAAPTAESRVARPDPSARR